jgi:hypothetical protein
VGAQRGSSARGCRRIRRRAPTQGRGGVPGNARTAVVNLTVVGAPARGYATIYPCGSQPNASTVNYAPGDTIANGVITKLDGNGRACIYTHRDAHLLLDISGTLPAAATGQSGIRSTALTESPSAAYERVMATTTSKVCHID